MEGKDDPKSGVSEDPTKVSNSAEPTTSARAAAIPVETVKSGVSVADCLTDHIIVEHAETNQFNSDYGILRDYGLKSWTGDQLLVSQLLNYERLMAMSRRTGVSLADSQEE